MARFWMGACAMVSSISANSIMMMAPLSLSLKYPVAYPFGRGNPDIAALKIDAEHVIVRWGRGDGDGRDFALRVANGHFRFAGGERRTIHRPVRSVVVGKALVGAEPCVVG